MGKLASIFGGNIGDSVAKIISLFKLDPTVAAQNSLELQKIQAELVEKNIDAANAEMDAAKSIIIAEAQSQSLLARNVRPLLLFVWGMTVAFYSLIPVIARFWIPGFSLPPLDPRIYTLTEIGFTGYVTARTWEKVTGADQ